MEPLAALCIFIIAPVDICIMVILALEVHLSIYSGLYFNIYSSLRHSSGATGNCSASYISYKVFYYHFSLAVLRATWVVALLIVYICAFGLVAQQLQVIVI